MVDVSIAARLERLPATRGFWRRLIWLSLGGFFEFYDLFLAAYIQPGLVKSGILTTTTPGLFGTTGFAGFVAAFFSGLFVGTALFGFVADKLGRRVIFTGSLLWYAAASLVMAFQQDSFDLNLWRFICGIGIGVELVTIDTYIAELAPPGMRARAFAVSNIIQFSAIPLAALLGWLLVPHVVLGLDGWRFVVIAGSVGAVLAWFVRARLPESPRWLASHGRSAEAEAIVEFWEVEARLEGTVLPEPKLIPTEQGKGNFREIWRRPYLDRTVMLIVFNVFQAAGYYGFASWVPALLVSSGISVTKSLGYTFIIAISAPFGPALGLLFDRLERKWVVMADGSKQLVTIPKRVKRWWRMDAQGNCFLVLRYGNRVITLNAGRTAIVVGPKSKLVSVIDTVITATKAGEMDAVLAAAQATFRKLMHTKPRKPARRA